MMQITEDTPPDMLAGAMDLTVHLPTGRTVKMSVERSTPMMDLLVHITTVHRLQQSGHILQALAMTPTSEHTDRILPYKPNTPIGVLDTQHVKVVAKNRSLSATKSATIGHQPFESTFRLQVHLPRNQLYVLRVSQNVYLGDVMRKVCYEKKLDWQKYEFRHPGNLDEVLNPKLTLSDYQITEVYVVTKGTLGLAQSFSSNDIMALRKEEERKQMQARTGGGVFSLIFKRGKTSMGTGSFTSENRSISPSHSDDSRSITPPVVQQQIPTSIPQEIVEKPKPPQRKRRIAPRPPPPQQVEDQRKNSTDIAPSHISTISDVSETDSQQKKSDNGLTICHSRNSSDSSGYHEPSVLSDHCNTSLPRRPKNSINEIVTEEIVCENKIKLNGNLSNMAVISKSSASIAGRKKKAAPPPPVVVAKNENVVTIPEKASPIVDASNTFAAETQDALRLQPQISTSPEPPKPPARPKRVLSYDGSILRSKEHCNRDDERSVEPLSECQMNSMLEFTNNSFDVSESDRYSLPVFARRDNDYAGSTMEAEDTDYSSGILTHHASNSNVTESDVMERLDSETNIKKWDCLEALNDTTDMNVVHASCSLADGSKNNTDSPRIQPRKPSDPSQSTALLETSSASHCESFPQSEEKSSEEDENLTINESDTDNFVSCTSNNSSDLSQCDGQFLSALGNEEKYCIESVENLEIEDSDTANSIINNNKVDGLVSDTNTKKQDSLNTLDDVSPTSSFTQADHRLVAGANTTDLLRLQPWTITSSEPLLECASSDDHILEAKENTEFSKDLRKSLNGLSSKSMIDFKNDSPDVSLHKRYSLPVITKDDNEKQEINSASNIETSTQINKVDITEQATKSVDELNTTSLTDFTSKPMDSSSHERYYLPLFEKEDGCHFNSSVEEQENSYFNDTAGNSGIIANTILNNIVEGSTTDTNEADSFNVKLDKLPNSSFTQLVDDINSNADLPRIQPRTRKPQEPPKPAPRLRIVSSCEESLNTEKQNSEFMKDLTGSLNEVEVDNHVDFKSSSTDISTHDKCSPLFTAKEDNKDVESAVEKQDNCAKDVLVSTIVMDTATTEKFVESVDEVPTNNLLDFASNSEDVSSCERQSLPLSSKEDNDNFKPTLKTNCSTDCSSTKSVAVTNMTKSDITDQLVVDTEIKKSNNLIDVNNISHSNFAHADSSLVVGVDNVTDLPRVQPRIRKPQEPPKPAPRLKSVPLYEESSVIEKHNNEFREDFTGSLNEQEIKSFVDFKSSSDDVSVHDKESILLSAKEPTENLKPSVKELDHCTNDVVDSTIVTEALDTTVLPVDEVTTNSLIDFTSNSEEISSCERHSSQPSYNDDNIDFEPTLKRGDCASSSFTKSETVIHRTKSDITDQLADETKIKEDNSLNGVNNTSSHSSFAHADFSLVVGADNVTDLPRVQPRTRKPPDPPKPIPRSKSKPSVEDELLRSKDEDINVYESLRNPGNEINTSSIDVSPHERYSLPLSLNEDNDYSESVKEPQKRNSANDVTARTSSSNKFDAMEQFTSEHVTQFDISNCSYLHVGSNLVIGATNNTDAISVTPRNKKPPRASLSLQEESKTVVNTSSESVKPTQEHQISSPVSNAHEHHILQDSEISITKVESHDTDTHSLSKEVLSNYNSESTVISEPKTLSNATYCNPVSCDNNDANQLCMNMEPPREMLPVHIPNIPIEHTETDLIRHQSIDKIIEDINDIDWEFHIPPPPSEFRDASPTTSHKEVKIEKVLTGPIDEVNKSESVVTSDCDSAISEDTKPMLNSLTLENLEKRKSLVYNREISTSLKIAQKNSNNSIDENDVSKRSSMLNELEEVIQHGGSRSLTRHVEQPAYDSYLPNFKISTYNEPKSKISIFEDDSIRSKSEEIINSDDSVFKKPHEFSKSKTISRNFYVKHQNHGTVIRSESFSTNLNWKPLNPVQRSKSQVALNKVTDGEENKTEDDSLTKSNSLFDVSGLQSLEVMRVIQNKLNTPSNSVEELDDHMENDCTNNNKCVQPMKEDVGTDCPQSTELESTTNTKTYQYQGPPAINLSTWSERPKSKVSLKEDTDYRISTINNNNNTYVKNNNSTTIKINGTDSTVKQESGVSTVIKLGEVHSRSNSDISNQTSSVNYRKPLVNINTIDKAIRPHSVAHESEFDISRVPIVRAVELKKSVAQVTNGNNRYSDVYRSSETVNRISNQPINDEISPVQRVNSFAQNRQKIIGFQGLETGNDNTARSRKSWNVPSGYSTLPAKISLIEPPAKSSNYAPNSNVPFSQVKLKRIELNKTISDTNNVTLRNAVPNSTHSNNRYSTGSQFVLKSNLSDLKSSQTSIVQPVRSKIVQLPSQTVKSPPQAVNPPPPPMPRAVHITKKSIPQNGNSDDPRDELLNSIRNFGGSKGLRHVKV